MIRSRRRLTAACAGLSKPALFAVLLLYGCEPASPPQLDANAYEQITPGMSYAEVSTLLGPADEQQRIALGPLGGLGGLESAEATWKFSDRTVIVRFVNDKSTIKEALTGTQR